jgi:hypothetical protein
MDQWALLATATSDGIRKQRCCVISEQDIDANSYPSKLRQFSLNEFRERLHQIRSHSNDANSPSPRRLPELLSSLLEHNVEQRNLCVRILFSTVPPTNAIDELQMLEIGERRWRVEFVNVLAPNEPSSNETEKYESTRFALNSELAQLALQLRRFGTNCGVQRVEADQQSLTQFTRRWLAVWATSQVAHLMWPHERYNTSAPMAPPTIYANLCRVHLPPLDPINNVVDKSAAGYRIGHLNLPNKSTHATFNAVCSFQVLAKIQQSEIDLDLVVGEVKFRMCDRAI